jgi:hypothetical protein
LVRELKHRVRPFGRLARAKGHSDLEVDTPVWTWRMATPMDKTFRPEVDSDEALALLAEDVGRCAPGVGGHDGLPADPVRVAL